MNRDEVGDNGVAGGAAPGAGPAHGDLSQRVRIEDQEVARACQRTERIVFVDGLRPDAGSPAASSCLRSPPPRYPPGRYR